MGHEDDGFGAMVAGVFDGGNGPNDPLVVCDVLIGIERDIEVDLKVDCQLGLCTQ